MQPNRPGARLYRQDPEEMGSLMDHTATSEASEFQRTLNQQISLYEADLEGLRLNGGEPDEITTFEMIVAELRRLQVEDLAELARGMRWLPAVQT